MRARRRRNKCDETGREFGKKLKNVKIPNCDSNKIYTSAVRTGTDGLVGKTAFPLRVFVRVYIGYTDLSFFLVFAQF